MAAGEARAGCGHVDLRQHNAGQANRPPGQAAPADRGFKQDATLIRHSKSNSRRGRAGALETFTQVDYKAR